MQRLCETDVNPTAASDTARSMKHELGHWSMLIGMSDQGIRDDTSPLFLGSVGYAGWVCSFEL